METRCRLCGQVLRLRKPRSTGPRSQSAHLHGHLQQIAAHCGYSMGEIKAVLKDDLAEWPRREVRWHGRVYMVPISESDATSDVESAAIEWCHRTAAELDVRLREE